MLICALLDKNKQETQAEFAVDCRGCCIRYWAPHSKKCPPIISKLDPKPPCYVSWVVSCSWQLDVGSVSEPASFCPPCWQSSTTTKNPTTIGLGVSYSLRTPLWTRWSPAGHILARPEIAQLDVDCAFLLITLNNRPHVHTFKSICDYKYDKGDL